MIRKYSVTLHGHRTSFSLEREFYDVLKSLAAERGHSLAGLIAEVDQNRDESDNLSSAIRLHVLRHLTEARSNRNVIQSAVAIVPVRNLKHTADFYVDTLGFTLDFMAPDESVTRLRRDGAAIRFVRSEDAGALAATASAISIHLAVNGVDELFASLRPALDKLPANSVQPPFDAGGGMREFHVRDPDGCLLIFGGAT